MPSRVPRFRIRTKLLLLNLVILSAFLMIITVILFSCNMIKDRVKEMTHRDMDRAIETSRLTREVTRVMAGLDVLGHTFLGRDRLLESEGKRLAGDLELITAALDDDRLRQPVETLGRQMESFLGQCLQVNTLFSRRRAVEEETFEQLAGLENLIADKYVAGVQESRNTTFLEQLLSLVTGYRESLMEIGRLDAEFRNENHLPSPMAPSPPVIQKIDDLALRLQTITASGPRVAAHGRAVSRNLAAYRDATLLFYREMQELAAGMAKTARTRDALIKVVREIELEITHTTRRLNQNIEQTMLSASYTVLGVSFIIIISLALFTGYLFKSIINTPMQAVLKGISSLGAGNFTSPIRLNRRDEWATIETGLNNMATTLSQSYDALEKSREKLKAKEAFLNAVFENIPDTVFVKDAKTLEFVRFNRAGEALLGMGRDKIIGRTCFDLLPETDAAQFTRTDHQVLETLEPVDIPEINLPTLEKGTRILHLKKLPLLDRHGRPKYLLGISRDITEQKRTDHKLLQMEKAESLSRMASAVAHNFNNMLAAVIGNLELALEDLPLERHIRHYLIGADQAAQKAADVSRLMLTYLGQQPMDARPLDLSATCVECLEQLAMEPDRAIRPDTDLPLPGPVVEANPGQVCQILNALATNAQEAMDEPDGRVCVSTGAANAMEIPQEFRFPTDWEPGCNTYAWIAFSDPGHGMAPDTLGKIFDPFYTSKFTGRGLGLAVVLGIVRSHRGCITVNSRPGKGTTFKVFFPLSDKALPKPSPPGTGIPAAAPAGGKILLVEDQDMVRNAAIQILAHLGFEPIPAAGGLQALDIFKVRHEEICLVVSDLSMPGMDGWETLEALRKIRPDMPVLLTSGYNEEQVMAGNHAQQPQGFVNKPFHIQSLRAAIEKILGPIHPGQNASS